MVNYLLNPFSKSHVIIKLVCPYKVIHVIQYGLMKRPSAGFEDVGKHQVYSFPTNMVTPRS